MKTENAINGAIGCGGSLFALITKPEAGIIAAYATAAWMLWQLGCSIYDRARRK